MKEVYLISDGDARDHTELISATRRWCRLRTEDAANENENENENNETQSDDSDSDDDARWLSTHNSSNSSSSNGSSTSSNSSTSSCSSGGSTSGSSSGGSSNGSSSSSGRGLRDKPELSPPRYNYVDTDNSTAHRSLYIHSLPWHTQLYAAHMHHSGTCIASTSHSFICSFLCIPYTYIHVTYYCRSKPDKKRVPCNTVCVFSDGRSKVGESYDVAWWLGELPLLLDCASKLESAHGPFILHDNNKPR